MKIVTFNMQQARRSRESWPAILEATDPDILLAQESLSPEKCQRPLLEETWSDKVVRVPVEGQHWGSSVYIKSQSFRQLDLPAFHGWVVGVELENHPLGLTGNRVRVFSLHAPTIEGQQYHTIVWEILTMLQDHRDGCDVVIGGDFNLTVSKRHETEERMNKSVNLEIQARLRDQFKLINCWKAKHPRIPLVQTLRWERDPIPPYHCDGIFVPESWASRLTSCEVLTEEQWVGLSDHNPVVAEFE